MAFATSTDNFRQLFNSPKADPKFLRLFLEGVKLYLEERQEDIDEAAKLHTWLCQGGQLSTSICQPAMAKELSRAFIRSGVPFLAVTDPNGNLGYLFRSSDNEAFRNLRQEALDAKKHYAIKVKGEVLQAEMLRNRDKDRRVVRIGNISADQAAVFDLLCDETLDGDMVGCDRMKDGTYLYSFPGRLMMSGENGKRKYLLVYLYLRMMMETQGMQGERNIQIAKGRAAFELALAMGFKRPGATSITPTWVVGDSKNYLSVTDEGFSYGIATVTDGTLNMTELYSVLADDPDYETQLVSCAYKIQDAAVTTDRKVAELHLAGQKQPETDLTRTPSEEIVDAFESAMIDTAMEAADEKLAHDRTMLMGGQWEDKLALLACNATDLLDFASAAASDIAKIMQEEDMTFADALQYVQEKQKAHEIKQFQLPKGFKRESLHKLLQICADRALMLSAYNVAIEQMRHPEISAFGARPIAIKDIDAFIYQTKKNEPEKPRPIQSLDVEREPSQEPDVGATTRLHPKTGDDIAR